MRVLHWYPNFLGGGGVANAVLGLAVSEARLGAEIGIAAMKLSGSPLYEPMDRRSGVTVLEWEPAYTLRSPGAFVHWVPKRAARALQLFEPDLVHVHGEFNPDNLWVPRLFKCPMVLSPHGGFHPAVFAKSRRTVKKLYFCAARHLFYRRVQALHALSGFEHEHLVRLLPGTQVYCAPQGPNIRAPLSVPPSGRTRNADEVRFVFVGRLDVFTKGLDLLLEAFAEVERRLRGQRQITLTLVGPDWGGSRARLESRKQQLGIASPVVFTGSLPSEEVTRTLHHSDIYVQLSRYEGYGLSITEALVAGKPTILSTAVGLASYAEITSLPHVRIVPPDVQGAADAMVDFALRLGKLNLLAEQNRAKVHAFCSWERVARLHLEVYEGIRRAGGVADGESSRRRRWPAWSSAMSSFSHRERGVGR